MQNPIQKFRQGTIVSKKPNTFLKKLKTMTSSDYRIELNVFCTPLFSLTNVYKKAFGIFLFLFLF